MNAYFICVIVYVKMWYVCLIAYSIKSKKNCWVFYMFLKVFLCFHVFRVFLHIAYFFFYLKTLLEVFSWEVSRVSSSHENEDGKNWKH